jgi:hypothetical protein
MRRSRVAFRRAEPAPAGRRARGRRVRLKPDTTYGSETTKITNNSIVTFAIFVTFVVQG